MPGRTVLLEFAEEIDAWSAARRDGDRVVALSLEVRRRLSAAGEEVSDSLPYFDDDDHAQAVRTSERWLVPIEEALREAGLPEDRTAEAAFCLRPAMNMLLWSGTVAVRAAEGAGAVVVGPDPESVRGADPGSWKVTAADRPLAALLADAPDVPPVEHLGVPVPDTTQAPPLIEPGLGGFGQLLSRFLVGRVVRARRGRPVFVLAADAYGLGDAVARALADAGLEDAVLLVLDLRAEPASPRRLAGLARRLRDTAPRDAPHPLVARAFPAVHPRRPVEDCIRTLGPVVESWPDRWDGAFVHRGLDCGPWLAEKFRRGITPHLLGMAATEPALAATLDAVRPDAVLSPYCVGSWNTLGRVCDVLDIPAMMVTHGTHVPGRDEVERIEHERLSRSLMLAPTWRHTAAQSPWAVRHAEALGAADRVVPTGPLLFARPEPGARDRLRRSLVGERDLPLVVYGVTQKDRRSLKFHVFETPDEYLASMADLVAAAARAGDLHLVLKLHPASEFSPDEIREMMPECRELSVLHREPFADVLSAADVIVSHSSTIIEEALAVRTPVVLWDRCGRYRHVDALDTDAGEPGTWGTDAAYWCSRADRLDSVLRHAAARSADAAADDALYHGRHVFAPGAAEGLGPWLRRCAGRESD